MAEFAAKLLLLLTAAKLSGGHTDRSRTIARLGLKFGVPDDDPRKPREYHGLGPVSSQPPCNRASINGCSSLLTYADLKARSST
jgi:hypothetical protein